MRKEICPRNHDRTAAVLLHGRNKSSSHKACSNNMIIILNSTKETRCIGAIPENSHAQKQNNRSEAWHAPEKQAYTQSGMHEICHEKTIQNLRVALLSCRSQQSNRSCAVIEGMFSPYAHVHMRALKGLACRARVTPTNLHACHACGCASLFAHAFGPSHIWYCWYLKPDGVS